jgi:hypothetical protein
MQEARNGVCDVAGAICDGLRQLGDFSYAILPRDIAHAVADFDKAVLAQIRSFADCTSEWIDERVAGGDKLRDEWREKCRPTEAGATPEPGV